MPLSAEPPSERDILCVKLAGLCHDLGHGPYSHTFEKLVPGFKHEAMSEQLLEGLFKGSPPLVRLSHFATGDEPLDDETDFNFVAELLRGAPPAERTARPRSKWYLYNIVANNAFGLDVDRLDYLLRDKLCAIGGDCAFSLDTIFDNAAVRIARFDDDPEPYPVIAFSQKTAPELWSVFRTRYDMFDKVGKGMGWRSGGMGTRMGWDGMGSG